MVISSSAMAPIRGRPVKPDSSTDVLAENPALRKTIKPTLEFEWSNYSRNQETHWIPSLFRSKSTVVTRLATFSRRWVARLIKLLAGWGVAPSGKMYGRNMQGWHVPRTTWLKNIGKTMVKWCTFHALGSMWLEVCIFFSLSECFGPPYAGPSNRSQIDRSKTGSKASKSSFPIEITLASLGCHREIPSWFHVTVTVGIEIAWDCRIHVSYSNIFHTKEGSLKCLKVRIFMNILNLMTWTHLAYKSTSNWESALGGAITGCSRQATWAAKYLVVYACKSSGSVSTLQKYSILMIHVYHVLSEMAEKNLLILESFLNSAGSPWIFLSTLSLPGLRRASKSSQRKASPFKSTVVLWSLWESNRKLFTFWKSKKETWQAEEDALASSEQ